MEDRQQAKSDSQHVEGSQLKSQTPTEDISV